MNQPNDPHGWGSQGGNGAGNANGNGNGNGGASGNPNSWQNSYQPQDDSWNLPGNGRYIGPEMPTYTGPDNLEDSWGTSPGPQGQNPQQPGQPPFDQQPVDRQSDAKTQQFASAEGRQSAPFGEVRFDEPAPGMPPEGEGRKSRTGLIIGALVLAIVLVLGTIGVLVFRDVRGGDGTPTAQVGGGAAASTEPSGSEASSPTESSAESTTRSSSSTSSTSQSPTSSAAPVDEGAEIRGMLDEFTAAFLKRDTATLVSMYCTADAGGPGRYEETFGFLEQHTGMSVEQAAQEYAPKFHVSHLSFDGEDAVGLTQLDFTSPAAQAAGVQPIWVIERGFRKEGGRWTICDAAQG